MGRVSQVGLFGLVEGVGSGWEDWIRLGQVGSGEGVGSSGEVRCGGWVGLVGFEGRVVGVKWVGQVQ